MKIRKAKKKLEYSWEDKGSQVKCPICREIWQTNFEGDVTLGECKHLRFYYFDREFVDFYGKWDNAKFEELYAEAKKTVMDKEGCLYILDLFKRIESDEIDEAIYVEFDHAPMYQPLGVWGYKKIGDAVRRGGVTI